MSDSTEQKIDYRLLVAWCVLALVLIAIDLLSKAIATADWNNTTLIPYLIDYQLYFNSGMAFGLFADAGSTSKISLTVLSVLVTFFILYQLFLTVKHRQFWLESLGLTMMMAGAIGNIYERIAFGQVTDFFHLYLGSFSFFIFNFADAYVSCGLLLIIISALLMADTDSASANTTS